MATRNWIKSECFKYGGKNLRDLAAAVGLTPQALSMIIYGYSPKNIDEIEKKIRDTFESWGKTGDDSNGSTSVSEVSVC